MANPETLERLAQACRYAGYAATVADHASVRTAGTSGEVLAVLRDEEQGRVAVRLRQALVPLDTRPGAASEQLRLALLLNARLEGARCALDDDNTFVLLDDVLAPSADLVPESVCRLWLLRGQAPWAARLLQQVAHGLTPEAVLSVDSPLDAALVLNEVERMLAPEYRP